MADSVVVAAAPKRVNNGVLVVPVAGGTENFVGVLVGVVAVAVTAVFAVA